MNHFQSSRRRTLGVMAGSALATLIAKPGNAQTDTLIRELVGKSPLSQGRESNIRIAIPELADTGFSVPVSVEVESSMTQSDFVKSIHLIAPRNPRPLATSITLSPLMARASWSTRMRLGTSQEVVAVAMMSDGSHRIARADVVVTISACIDGT